MPIDLLHPVDSFDFGPHLQNADWMAMEDCEVELNLELDEELPHHDQPGPSKTNSVILEKRQRSLSPQAETLKVAGTSPSSKFGLRINGHRNEKRRTKRAAATAELGHIPRIQDIQHHVQESLLIPSDLDVKSLGARGGGYTAKYCNPRDSRREVNLEDLLKSGFRLIEWDGICSKVLVDSKSRIYSVLAGRPDDLTYVQAAEATFHAMADEATKANFVTKECNHKRGRFPAVSVGLSYGQGQLQPAPLDTGKNSGMMERILQNTNVQRIATFGSAAFQLFAPKLFEYYKERIDKVYQHLPEIPRIFPKSIFPLATFNFGPAVHTFIHRDVMNCPFGWCAIHALGSYDARKGGHIILWEPKVVIEFPPASTILIPSATISHSNIAISSMEQRASFTQYCQGGLFRWVDNGFRLEEVLKVDDPEEYKRICKLKETRWEMGLGLLPRVSEVVNLYS